MLNYILKGMNQYNTHWGYVDGDIFNRRNVIIGNNEDI